MASVAIDALVPGGTARVLGPANVTLAGGDTYSFIAAGEAAALSTIAVARPVSPVPAGSVRASVVHVAPNAPRVDVYVTAPDAVLAQTTPVGAFAFGESLGPVTVPAGDYRVRVTLPNDPGTVVFDSGTATLPSGGDLLIVAVENTETGAAPISLLVATADDGSFEIRDLAAPAELRVIHASPDAPAVDVVVNEDFANPCCRTCRSRLSAIISGTARYVRRQSDRSQQSGRDRHRCRPDARSGPAILCLRRGHSRDHRAARTHGRQSPRCDGGQGAHRAYGPSAGNVDIYVTEPGADITNVAPAFGGPPFGLILLDEFVP